MCVRKLEPEQISIGNFEAALKSNCFIVVDVRVCSEYVSGCFPGAINISLDELPTKLDDLPSDKFVAAHCQSGVQGETAYLFHKEKGIGHSATVHESGF